MSRQKLRRVVLLGATAVLVGVMSAGAAPWEEKTVLTFSEAVTLPGVMPVDGVATAGRTVSIDGFVMQMPDTMSGTLSSTGAPNCDI